VQTSIIIIHLGKNTNRTVPKNPTPNSSHVEHENSWQNSITSMQYDQKHTIMVQLP